MKKTLLALTLVLSLVLSVAALSVSADATPITFDFSTATVGTGYANSGWAFVDGTAGVGGSACAALKVLAGGWGGKSTSAQVGEGTELLSGTRRTKAIEIAVPAGTYTVTLWMSSANANYLTAGDGAPVIVPFINFYDGADPGYDWITWNKPAQQLVVFNPYDKEATYDEAMAGNNPDDVLPWLDAEMTAGTTKTDGGKTWQQFTGTITLPANVTSMSIACYCPNYMGNGSTDLVYIDDLTLTPAAAGETTTAAEGTTAATTAAPGATSGTTTAPDNGDVASIVALVAVIGTAGVAFAAKKKH